MADDQATLGTFAGDDTDGADGDAAEADADTQDTAAAPGDGAEEPAERADETTESVTTRSDDGLVCPWCLAPNDRFVERGPTGLACSRCAAALPVDADWFRAREVVARRPMYEVEE